MNFAELVKKRNLSIGVVGVGESNIGVIGYIKKINPDTKITLRSDVSINTNDAPNHDRAFIGDNALADITEDILFLSPSVRRSRKEITDAKAKGVIISSDAELFFALTDSKPICITGSDGKSTTTHLVAKALSLSGIPSSACGNYGRSLSSLLNTYVFPAIELSSFQLNYMKPSSSCAVITNVTPNHLNWHSSLEEYVEAKMNLTENADRIVFDCDSDIISDRLKNESVFCKTSLEKSYSQLKAIGGAANYTTYSNGIIYFNGSAFLDISRAKRQEPYNIRNFLLTVSACISYCKEKAIKEAILDFPGLEHRAELVLELNGIKYVDSSIDSSPERTLKTLRALKGNTVVIIGGLGKGLSLDKLAEELPFLTKGAVLLGEVGRELSLTLSSRTSDYSFAMAKDMSDAITIARSMIIGDGTVILSPAATSFDLYKNFKDRGDDFKRIVKEKP